MFARFGVGGAPLTAISAAAGCDLATLTRHFTDNEEILAALVELIRREATELFLLTLPDGLSIAEKLELLLIHQAEWGDRRSQALQVCGYDEPLRLGYLDGVAKWLDRHNALEELDMQVDTMTAAHLLQAIQRAFYERWMARGAEEQFIDNVPDVLHVFLHGVTPA